MRTPSRATDTVDVCRHACRHADCCMERGDTLPLGITAYWPDGTPYVPRSGSSDASNAGQIGPHTPFGEGSE